MVFSSVSEFVIATLLFHALVVAVAYAVSIVIVAKSPERRKERNRIWSFPILLLATNAVAKSVATLSLGDIGLFLTVPWVIELSLTTILTVAFYGVCWVVWRFIGQGRFPLLGMRTVVGAVGGVLGLVCYAYFVLLGFIVVISMLGTIVGFLLAPFIVTLGPVGGVLILAWITTGEFPLSIGALMAIMGIGLLLGEFLVRRQNSETTDH